jgi:hypothetical protein
MHTDDRIGNPEHLPNDGRVRLTPVLEDVAEQCGRRVERPHLGRLTILVAQFAAGPLLELHLRNGTQGREEILANCRKIPLFCW